MNATRRSIEENKQETFQGFKDANILTSFYSLFLKLVNKASAGLYDIQRTRQLIITHLLSDIDPKYDYILEDQFKIEISIPNLTISTFHVLPSKTKIFVETWDFNIAAFNINTGALISQVQYKSNYRGYVIFKSFLSMKGKDRIAISSTLSDSIKIWNPDDGTFILEIPYGEAEHMDYYNNDLIKVSIMNTMISQTGVPIFVVGMNNGDIRLWNSETGSVDNNGSSQRHPIINKTVNSLLMIKNKIIAGYGNGIIKLWDLENPEKSVTKDTDYHPRNGVSLLLKIDDTRIIFQIYGMNARLWNIDTDTTRTLVDTSKQHITAKTMNVLLRDDTILVLTNEGVDVYDLEGKYKYPMTLPVNTFNITNINVLPNNDVIAFGMVTLLSWEPMSYKTLQMNGVSGKVLADGTVGFMVRNKVNSTKTTIEIYQ